MNLREAANIAWHARTNGLADISEENLLGALAVLERLLADEDGAEFVRRFGQETQDDIRAWARKHFPKLASSDRVKTK